MNTKRTADAVRLQGATAGFGAIHLLYDPENGARRRHCWVLSFGQTSVGRGDHVRGIALTDRRVSEAHACIAVATQASECVVHVVDSHSTNGLFVNGRQVGDATLEDGDVLRVGRTLLLFRFETAEQHGPAEPLEAVERLLRGESSAIRELRSELANVGADDVEVLLLGESGAGKELAALAVHLSSPRSGGPFVAVNCSAIPAPLAESQLFGHVAGAFTGAKEKQSGLFAAADGGTLFLDELGELPLELQPKLLRVLEDHQITPVGSTISRSVDVRVVAATNRDLRDAVREGRFRGDLYARLASYPIRLPPLRERREDILPLLSHFYGNQPLPITPRLAEALVLYSWPFNVRELKKMAEGMRILAKRHGEIDLPHVADRLWPPEKMPMDLPDRHELRGSADSPAERQGTASQQGPRSRRRVQQQLDKATLDRLLAEHRGVISYVADAAGRSRKHIRRLIEQFSLDKNSYRDQ